MSLALASAFLAALDPGAAGRAGAPDALGARLATLVLVAREAWPRIPLDASIFVEHIARHAAGTGDPRDVLDERRAGDLWLACACARGEPLALRALEDGYLRAASRALARFGDPHGFVADALQELRQRLLMGSPPRIAAYSGQGSLQAWIKVAAMRVGINLRHKELVRGGLTESDDDEVEVPAATRDPELEFIKARYRGDFSAALREAFAELTPDERTMLRFYLIDRLNIAEIGSIFGVTRSTVGRWIVRCREKLLDAMGRRLKERLRIDSEELESMMGAMQSQVDLSLSQVLMGSRVGHGE